ncbi:hypothetical protein [Streptomyces sp. NPDC006193]|uniref:hypothetical protein n=1 Tax=Streptomyces sp. NPDC006193 TaxID=3155717 RepID=UPI0033A5623A
MIPQVSHHSAGRGPAHLALALSVAHELHVPVPAPRAPQVATPAPELMGLRIPADRPHRRKVPLHRLATMRGMAVLGA